MKKTRAAATALLISHSSSLATTIRTTHTHPSTTTNHPPSPPHQNHRGLQPLAINHHHSSLYRSHAAKPNSLPLGKRIYEEGEGEGGWEERPARERESKAREKGDSAAGKGIGGR
ncbi:hypothetical protein Droror1_Dr00019778 [Drosera rotundifolia]